MRTSFCNTIASRSFRRAALVGVALLTMHSVAFAEIDGKGSSAVAIPLDVSASSVGWVGKKVTGQHNGTVSIKSGEAKLEGGRLVGGTFEVDLSSIRVDDIKDPSDNKKLTNHLLSEDFFAASLFPAATFTITKAEVIAGTAAGQPNYNITGDLEIKGIKNSVTFPATVNVADGKAQAKAKFELDRTKWNVRYGSGQFFENLGNRLIYDTFEIALDVVGEVSQS